MEGVSKLKIRSIAKWALLSFFLSIVSILPLVTQAGVVSNSDLAILKRIVDYSLPEKPGFNTGNAALMGFLSHMIYNHAYSPETNNQNHKQKFREKLQQIGLVVQPNRIHYQRGGISGTDYIIFATDSAVFVVFQGTQLGVDYLTDGLAIKIPGPNGVGGVHSGFSLALNSIYNAANAKVASYMDGENKHVYITGHSLGGALASMYAYRRTLDGNPGNRKVTGVYTIASPRVGDHDFAAAYKNRLDGKSFRIKYNEYDPNNPHSITESDHVTEFPNYGPKNNLLAKADPIGWYNHVGKYLRLQKKSGKYSYKYYNFNVDDKLNIFDIFNGVQLNNALFLAHHDDTEIYAKPMIEIAEKDTQLNAFIASEIKKRNVGGGGQGTQPPVAIDITARVIEPFVQKGHLLGITKLLNDKTQNLDRPNKKLGAIQISVRNGSISSLQYEIMIGPRKDCAVGRGNIVVAKRELRRRSRNGNIADINGKKIALLSSIRAIGNASLGKVTINGKMAGMYAANVPLYVKVRLDPNNAYKEKNESNNCLVGLPSPSLQVANPVQIPQLNRNRPTLK